MGSGLTYLFWYFLCALTVGGIVGVGAGLYFWGRRREKREGRRLPPDPPPS